MSPVWLIVVVASTLPVVSSKVIVWGRSYHPLPNLFVPICPTVNQLRITSETLLLVSETANQVRYPLLYDTCDAPVEILEISLRPGFCVRKSALSARPVMSPGTTPVPLSVCSHGKLVLSTINDSVLHSGLNAAHVVSNTISKSWKPEARVVVNGIS